MMRKDGSDNPKIIADRLAKNITKLFKLLETRVFRLEKLAR